MSSRRQKTRIVVVEDDRASRKLLTRILEVAGYDVIECAEGRDAIHIAEMCPPAVMVVDVMLPDMQGTEIVDELSSKPDLRFTKFIFLTGILSKKDGSSNYFFEIEGTKYRALQKPIRKGQLLQILASASKASFDAKEKEKVDRDNAVLEKARLKEEYAAAAKSAEEEVEEYSADLMSSGDSIWD